MPRPLKKDSCNTCRQRKVKCDEKQPVCSQCSKSSRYCDRSTRSMVFISANSAQSQEVLGNLPPTDPRESLNDQLLARLFQHYINTVSKWYDLSDASRHFEVIVPDLALSEPLLFCAVIAFAAMHLSKTKAAKLRSVAEAYHTACISVLLTLNEGDELIAKGIALTATCLLRSYEILAGEFDPNMHLRGAYSMASAQGLINRRNRDLLQAGFWNYLREDITFSLYESCPLKMDLSPVPLLCSHETDQDYLNSISLILGRIVNMAFGRQSKTERDALVKYLQQWKSFRPSRLEPFSRCEAGNSQNLPSLWFTQECHASTMHYYLVSLFILIETLDDGIDDLSHLDPFGRAVDSKTPYLELLALDIAGVAFTSRTPPVVVNAFGPISYCARYIQDEAARQEMARQLLACKPDTGWPVKRLVESLQRSWGHEVMDLSTPSSM